MQTHFCPQYIFLQFNFGFELSLFLTQILDSIYNHDRIALLIFDRNTQFFFSSKLVQSLEV